MEIPCVATASIPGTCVNLLLLERYTKIIEENYSEPKEETILGSFLAPTTDEIIEVNQVVPNKKKNVNSNQPKCKDIHTFFTMQGEETK